MRIAIASSGLGHVARGIETWALDTAVALSSAQVISSLLSVVRNTNNEQPITNNILTVTLFSAAPLPPTVHCPPSTVPLKCLKRGDRCAHILARIMPPFTWRWGWKDTYGWEQFTFWLWLWPQLRQGRYDILHVQDPMLAYWCRKFRKWGLVKTREILAHGTEEPAEFLAQFEYVQHLAPWHLHEALKALRRVDSCPPSTGMFWTALPNFVDCGVFHPAGSLDEKKAARRAMGVPEDAFVTGCVAVVKKDHKRVDYLIREFARFAGENVTKRKEEFEQKPAKDAKNRNDITAGGGEEKSSLRSLRASVQYSSLFQPFLLIAGARTSETDELVALAESLIPGRYKILTDCARAQMPELYRAMDVFVLASLFEMMPIALLEALASGLPCLVNRHPVLEWMVGAGQLSVNGYPLLVTTINNQQPITGNAATGGLSIDMSQDGALAQTFAGLTPEWLDLQGRQARERALAIFSKEAVIGKYVEYYATVMKVR